MTISSESQLAIYLNPYIRPGEHPLFTEARAKACQLYCTDVSGLIPHGTAKQGEITLPKGQKRAAHQISSEKDQFLKTDGYDRIDTELKKHLKNRDILAIAGAVVTLASLIFLATGLLWAAVGVGAVALIIFSYCFHLRYRVVGKLLDQFGENAVRQAQEYFIHGPQEQSNKILENLKAAKREWHRESQADEINAKNEKEKKLHKAVHQFFMDLKAENPGEAALLVLNIFRNGQDWEKLKELKAKVTKLMTAS